MENSMMNGISRNFSVAGALAVAVALVAAAPTLANAGHNVYPPGWDTPTQPSGKVLYQFLPGGDRYHVVAPATTDTGTTK
jgi:hypothetical protein